MRTIRDDVFDVLRAHQMTKIFANPGSTEVPLLVDLPDDLEFVLGLHEASVVGMATGWAIGSGQAGLVLLHTTAGLGNAVGAIATARVNRAPLVVLVGQQDRRHVSSVPFLAGELEGLAGNYPVWVGSPARAQDLASVVSRAHHEAVVGRGPALVIVPMNDWNEPSTAPARIAAPTTLRVAAGLDSALSAEVSELLTQAERPVLVVGAGADDEKTWLALKAVAEVLDCPVWQEPFGARAGFPQQDGRFIGHLPSGRSGLRAALKDHDLVLVVGAPALRQYNYEEGPLFAENVTVVVVSDDASEAAYSTSDIAVVTPLAPFFEAIAAQTPPRELKAMPPRAELPDPPPPVLGEPLRPQHVFGALQQRLPDDLVIVEESPSSRSDLQAMVPPRQSLGFLSAAMGGLGFALPAATGLKMALPHRSIVAVVGDGSSLYSVQALWSAQHYGVGVLFVVLSNGGYAIMNHLAHLVGGKAPWPNFADVRVEGLATALGCPARRIETYEELLNELDSIIPTLPTRRQPILLNVVVSA
ncbi:thiamine pyrophosphate-binding protein [Streptomyces sp. NBC_01356]|uniref:thiamine pyrophosphate-dependent enzyme n=1 Tax=Streptomyces sp. NBC_01356 TaxID=2903836 RepID=UPI002E31EB5A|nr:thiamine pyrophosphate-dependent enzyme [Streptomyces sp. NBC_01356]